MIKYSVVFVINDLGQILGVSRKDDITKFGLPGGSIEINESSFEAAVRETLEETGIVISKMNFVYSDSETDCYLATNWSGEVQTQEIGIVKWLTVRDLIDHDSAFPEYNITAIDCLKKFYPEIHLR